jgi:hypothetical protein
MIIPQTFKNLIAKVFYDKDIFLYTTSQAIDNDGWMTISDSTITTTFKGNVKLFTSQSEPRKDYGIDLEVDAVLTTDKSDLVEDNILGWNSKKFRIVKIHKFDSHYEYWLKEWDSNSYDMISA